MAGGEDPARAVEVDAEGRSAAPRLRRLRQRCAARDVEHPLGHECGRAIGRDVGETDGETDARSRVDSTTRSARAQPEHGDGLIRAARMCRPARAPRPGRWSPGRLRTGCRPSQAGRDPDRRVVGEQSSPCRGRVSARRPSVVEGAAFRSCRPAGGQERRRAIPRRRGGRDRRLRSLHVDDDRRFVHDAVRGGLAPVVEPAHHLAQVVDPRPRDGRVGQRVVPRPDEHLHRHAARGKPAIQPQRRVRIAVAPAADQERRAADRRRPSPTEPLRQYGPSVWCRSHCSRYGSLCGEVLLPDAAQSSQRPFGVGRHRVPRDHARAVPADVVVHAQQAAAVVAVVGVAIVREVDRDDRGQVRRCEGRDLERREAAVGDADHR